MLFADNTGHIFELPSYDREPIGYKYVENRYIFWIDNKNTSFLSLGQYYIKPIYVVSETKVNLIDIITDIENNNADNIFNLIGSKIIQDDILSSLSENHLNLNIDYDNIKQQLSFEDIVELCVDNYYVYPFYIIAKSDKITGTLISNIMIHTVSEGFNDWCYISVGAEFNADDEVLTINGRNMGIRLPRDIIKAVYQGSYNNDEFDINLYKEKLKEYLLNKNTIRDEVGNYKSVVDSLKWFGYGDHVTISSLLQTDNIWMTQFIRDYFDIHTDLLESFDNFVHSTLISLSLKQNVEDPELSTGYDLSNDFYGEDHPLLIDLFNKVIEVKYDNVYNSGRGEQSTYYRSYYLFSLSEMMLKLSALKVNYEKYFLPVHLNVNVSSVEYKTYANDIKFLNRSTTSLVEPIVQLDNIYINHNDDIVVFPENNIIWMTEQVHIVDELFNEWILTQEDIDKYDWYYIHDTCFNIPLKFANIDDSHDIVMILECHDKSANIDNYTVYIKEYLNDYIRLDENSKYNITIDDISITSIDNNILDNKDISWSYSIDDGKNYSSFISSLSALYDVMLSSFIYKTQVESSKDPDTEKKFYFIKVYDGYEEHLFKLYDYAYIETKNDIKYVIPSLNDIGSSLFNINDKSGIDCQVLVIPNNILLRFKYNHDKVNKVMFGDKNVTDDVIINYPKTSQVIFEYHETLYRPQDNYSSLVIYPKMFKDVNISWIGSKFTLRILVDRSKWYNYDFTVNIPDINIDLGTLHYRYYDDEYNLYSPFCQLYKLEEDDLSFNAYMREPKLATFNDLMLFDNFIEYLNITNARYVNNIPMNSSDIAYIIVKFEYKGKTISSKVYISSSNMLNKTSNLTYEDVLLPLEELNISDQEDLYVIVYNQSEDNSSDENHLMYFRAQTINDNNTTYRYLGDTYANSIYVTNNINTINDDLYGDYLLLHYNKNTNSYKTNIFGQEFEFPIYHIINDINTDELISITENENITNNIRYKNRVHVFDIYKQQQLSSDNKIMLHNDTDLKFHGIRFTHTSFTDDTKLHISGKYSNLSMYDPNIDYNRENNPSMFESMIQDSEYSSYINTYDDLTIYTAYNGDLLEYFQFDIEEPTGYIYYTSVKDIKEDPFKPTSSKYSEVDVLTPLTYYFTSKSISEIDNKITQEQDNYNNSHTQQINRSDITFTSYIGYKDTNTQEIQEIKPSNQLLSSIYDKDNDCFYNDNDYYFVTTIYAKTTQILNNIEHIYDKDDVTIDENGYYIGHVRGYTIRLYPYYNTHISKYDNYKDSLLNQDRVISNQPGIDWFNVNDDFNINDINYIYREQYMTSLDIDDILNNDILNNDINDSNSDNSNSKFNMNSDMTSLLKYRSFLRIDITDSIRRDVYSKKLIEESNIKYIINTNIEQEDNKVNVLTIVREVLDNNVTYYDTEFTINKDTFKSLDELHDKDKLHYDVFFVLIYNNEDNNHEDNNHEDNNNEDNNHDDLFNITINPEIRYQTTKYYERLPYNPIDYIDYNQQTVDIIIGNKKYTFGEFNQSVIDLYNEFFIDDKLEVNKDTTIHDIHQKDDLNIDNDNINYDMYLMHDDLYWYMIYISKNTIGNITKLSDLELKQDNIYHNEYKLQLVTSGYKFMLERYEYISSKGKNRFNDTDIIAAIVTNNNRLPIDKNHENKWDISPMSLGLSKDDYISTSTSKTEMTILNLPINDNKYNHGYYDIIYRYNIDSYITRQLIKSRRLRVI